jgi:hypothetical protein
MEGCEGATRSVTENLKPPNIQLPSRKSTKSINILHQQPPPMAGQIPDPQTLNTWEDAFQHPLPVVRKLEQQLRKNIDDNRQKLRSLVGASYRDLLGTAERIIEMDQQMENVESNLGDIGRRCNARTVERILENGAQMRKSLNARDEDKHAAMAQTKVLQSALAMVLRIVKGGGDALQASKLLVLSRLLFKSVSEGRHVPSMLEELRKKLAILRKKLLSYITAAMVKPSDDKNFQANILSAYSLVTSSAPKEVLRHFLQVRYEQLDSRSDSPSEADILLMLDLYSQTLVDTRDLFPRRFSESLAQLAKSPLIRDEQLKSAFELNLDVYGQWIAEDVRTFTLWIRHDQLSSKEVADALEAWSKQAQECLLRGVGEFLESQSDAIAVVETRRKVISKYLALSSRLRDGEHTKTIQALREAFLQRLQVLATDAAAIGDMKFDDVDTSRSEQTNSSLQSMWELAAEDLDLSNGALAFRRSVVQTRNSRTARIRAAGEGLDSWMKRIEIILDLIDNMRTDKWDSDLDFELDDVDDSDALLQSLNKSDPEKLRNGLRDAAAVTLKQLGNRVNSDSSNATPAFHIRVWREVSQRHLALSSRLSVPMSEVSLSKLHQNLAQSVSRDPIEAYIQSAMKTTHATIELWDGSPPLPNQPSPATFRLLKSLHQAMSTAGNDLWGSNAIQELKATVLDALSAQLDEDSFTKLRRHAAVVNGHAEDGDEAIDEAKLTNGVDPAEDTSKEQLIQKLFDVQYLRRVFYHKHQGERQAADLSNVAKSINEELQLDGASKERLEKNANEYWRRTYLLFGLLAGG